MHIIAKSLLSLLLILTLSLQPVMGAQINDSIFMSPQADPYSLALRSGLGDLNIESRQDTSTYDRDSWGLNLGLNLGGGSGQAGQLGDIVEGVTSNPSADSLSIGGSFGKGEGESHWVETQAGISGDTLNIDVEGNTNLKGGTIIAENEEASSLETGTLTHSNIADKHIREDIDVSANIGIGGNGLSGSVDGGYEFTAREQDNKATANIEITITDEEAQDQLVEDGVTEDLAALNTDPDQAQVITRDERNAVDFYVSDQAVKAVGEVLTNVLKTSGLLSNDAADLVADIQAGRVSEDVLAQCSDQSYFRFQDLFITRAYAADVCTVKINGKTYVLSKVDVENCERVLAALDGAKTREEIYTALREIADDLAAEGNIKASNQVELAALIGLSDIQSAAIVNGLDVQNLQDALDILGEAPGTSFDDTLQQYQEQINRLRRLERIANGTLVEFEWVKEETEQLAADYAQAQKEADALEGTSKGQEIVGYDYDELGQSRPITAYEAARRDADQAYAKLIIFATFVPADTDALIAEGILTAVTGGLGNVIGGAGKGSIAAGKIDEAINSAIDVNRGVKGILISETRANHILHGDGTGGGHLWPGAPGKSAFPQNWSSTKVLDEINSIASDTSIPGRVQGNGRIVKEATVDGIDIRVVIEPPSKGGGVVTGFPTNVPRNPK